MSTLVYYLKYFVYIILFLLSTCGIIERPSDTGEVWEVRKAQWTARQQELATLKPPYTEWDWEKKPDSSRLTIQNAVWAITKQVGKKYNHQKSHKNTYPICRQWIQPDFENKPWKEAVADILAPYGLTYFMEGNTVVLIKVEDAAKRDAMLRALSEDIARFVSSDSEPPRLHDAVIVFPLLDESGKTTELGMLLSELGMLKATYTPHKMFNLHVPSIIAPRLSSLYSDVGFEEAGKPLTPEYRKRIMARFGANDSAVGTLELAADGSFRVVLSFEGEHGNREFSTSGPKGELYHVPQWIARCVHEYCGMDLSPAQQEYVNRPDLSDTAALFELLELETQYKAGRKNREPWRVFLRFNPRSIFALYRYYLVSTGEKQDDSLNYITGALRDGGGHELLRFLEADWYRSDDDDENAVPKFLELLKTDYRNEELYQRMDGDLMNLGLGESAVSLYDFWRTHEPDSYLPLLEEGVFYVNYAWHARGSGWAWTVTEDGWKKFRERLPQAEEYLSRSCELNTTDPRAPTELMIVARGLGYGRGQMEKWFKRAVEAYPPHYDAYRMKLTYLMPKWGGSREEMFAFARKCAANPPEGSRVAMMLLEAHEQMSYDLGDYERDWAKYYENPEVWRELKGMYEKYLLEHPESVWDRNFFAKYSFYAHDYGEAVRQFQLIGTDIEKRCWGSDRYYYQCRAEAYAKAGGGQRR